MFQKLLVLLDIFYEDQKQGKLIFLRLSHAHNNGVLLRGRGTGGTPEERNKTCSFNVPGKVSFIKTETLYIGYHLYKMYPF